MQRLDLFGLAVSVQGNGEMAYPAGPSFFAADQKAVSFAKVNFTKVSFAKRQPEKRFLMQGIRLAKQQES
jgi:hypothetical protein